MSRRNQFRKTRWLEMAIVPRKRSDGTVIYNVSLEPKGLPPIWKKVGPNKREAEREEAKIKKALADGTYEPEFGTTTITVAQYFEVWIAKRDPEKVRSKDDEERWVRRHMLGQTRAKKGS